MVQVSLQQSFPPRVSQHVLRPGDGVPDQIVLALHHHLQFLQLLHLLGGHEAVSDNVLVGGEPLLDLVADHAEGEYLGQAEPPDHDPPDVPSSVLARQVAGQVHGKLVRPGEGLKLVPPPGHYKGHVEAKKEGERDQLGEPQQCV